jgi:REP element-mobilizing transposase RayT
MLATRKAQRRRKKVWQHDQPPDAHFLTFSCYRRMQLLGKDRTRRWLIESLQAARQKRAFDLWAWSSAADWAGREGAVLRIDCTIPRSTQCHR